MSSSTTTTDDEEVVSLLLLQSIIRVCGSGIRKAKSRQNIDYSEILPCPSCTANDNSTLERMSSPIDGEHSVTNQKSTSHLQWRLKLESLVKKSISYPHRKNSTHPQKDKIKNDDFGKEHDVEIRIALSLFNQYCNGDKRDEKASKKQEKRKRKENVETHNSDDQLTYSNNIEITSDLGLVRTISTAKELSSLLVNDMEDQLWNQRVMNIGDPDRIDISLQNIIMMIQANQSGIIYIVTTKRFIFLRSHDRYPCSHCTKWCKGQKGLWWHEQIVHGLDHSSAAVVAAATSSSHDSLAIIPYENNNQTILYGSQVNQNDDVQNNQDDLDPFFEAMKCDDYDAFLRQLNHQKVDAKSHQDKNGATAIHWASGSGRLRKVKHLVETCFCSPDQKQNGKRSFRGRTPLHWSARNGHLHVVKYLVEDCNVGIDAKTIDGTTAFCWASWQGHLPIMQYLFERGADVTLVNKFGCNAILWSAQSNQSGVQEIQFLFNIGCDAHMINSNGHGILHKAAQRGNKDICKWVLTHIRQFYDFNTGNSNNETNAKNVVHALRMIAPDVDKCCPSDLAGQSHHTELAQWLVSEEMKLSIEVLQTKGRENIPLPLWLQSGLSNAKHLSNRIGLEGIWESSAGVKKIGAFMYEKELYTRM